MTQLANPKHTFVQLTLLDLEKLEKRVTEGLAKFIEVGQALAEIQNREGYKLRGHKTFEEYCEKQFGFSLRHGQRLIAAAETAQEIKKLTGGDAPKNESAARVLAPIVKDEKTVKRVEAELKKRKQTFATATAEKIQEVVERVTGKTKAESGVRKEEMPQPTLFVAADPTKAAQAATHAECPHCHIVPSEYYSYMPENGEKVFICGNCKEVVALQVTAAVAAKRCPICNSVVGANDDFCGKCGEVLQ